MSNKTIFKRIALVAVAALGAGLLTVTPATAADNPTVGGNNVASVAGILNVATAASITGDAVVSNGAENPATPTNSNRSRGLLSNSTTLGVSSLSSTATMRADGEIVFYTTSAAAGTGDPITSFVLEGGARFTDLALQTSTASTDAIYNQSRTQLVIGDEDVGSVRIAFAVTPDAGTTSFTLSMYTTTSTENEMYSETCTNVSIVCVANGSVSKGSLVQRYTVTVASGASSNTYSAATSRVQGVLTAKAADSAIDETDSLTIANSASSVAYIAVLLRDAYEVELTGGALSISGTNGAGIAYKGDNTADTPVNTSAVSNDANGLITVARPSAFANKAFTTTVTVTFNGVVVGTKTVKFLGEVAKIAVTIDAIAQAGGSVTDNADFGSIQYFDDAGNVLLPSSGTSVRSTTLNAFVTNASVTTWPTTADPYAYYGVACGGNATTASGTGSASIVFRHTNPFSGSNIDSTPVTVTCAGNPATYKASFDKATYAPGEVATLTISGLDNAGKPANALYNFQSTTSGSEFSITAPQMTAVSAVSTTSVKFSSGAGIKTYKFTVGNTEGSYNAIVAIPKVNALLLGGANQTVAYKIAAPATGAVSNAEVLAAIVKLIASINKQIRALQKSLRR